MTTPTPLQAITLKPTEGRALWHLGALLVFKALGAETNGQYWALEGFADKQMAVPLHSHSREDEIWYVLEGEIEFILGAEHQIGTVGSFVYIPRDTPHTFMVRSETARWFGFGTPAGLDQWFFETGQPAPSRTLPPPPDAAPDVAAIITSLQRYGTDTLGPPPNLSTGK
jgi:quercetin dioxygenase-like cupin family protein